MLTIGQERSAPTEIDVGQNVEALTFTTNGEYLVSGQEKEVRVWRVDNGKQVARMETRGWVWSLAASKNGKWIAAGTAKEMLVWDAETYEEVIKHEEGNYVNAVDFSPDSTRLVAGTYKRVIVWDLATGKQVQTLDHERYVFAAKYSPQGDRIATAEVDGPVQVWDGNDGRLLVDIDVKVIPQRNTGLLWSHDHLLVVSDKKIEEFDASTGSKVSEWPVPDTGWDSCIALPKHEQFTAFSSQRIITFRDTLTHNQLPLTLQHPEFIHSAAFSPDDRILAIGGGGEITIQSLSDINMSATFCRAISSLNSFLASASSPSVSPTSYFPRT